MLSFIVPVRNDADRLRRCLASIRNATDSVASEIIVVDNGSTDTSPEVARSAGARVLELPGGRAADLRNAGAQVAQGDVLAFVDADHELGTGWAQTAVELLGNREVLAAGAQYFAPPDGTWVQRIYDRFRRHRPGRHEVDWLPSGNLLVRREVFDRIGGFDRSLETCEDVDLCRRLTAAGARLVADDRLRSVHRGDPETLKALFLGEMWRGRDNLRVSLRAPLMWRSLPSLAVPVFNLAALLAVLLGFATWGLGGRFLVIGGAAVYGLLTIARAASLVLRGGSPPPDAVVTGQAVVVAGVYDLARALALVARSGHALRRQP